MPRRRSRTARAAQPHVALIVETSTVFGRQVLRGVGIYLRENGPWSVYIEQRSIYDPAPPWLKNWRGDGIISRAAYPELAQLVLHTGIPAIDLQEQVLGLGLPRIVNDNRAIGRMAAEHLLERGFTHFGFIGHPGIAWSEGRFEGFEAAVCAAGHTVDRYRGAARTLPRYHQRSWEKEVDDVAAWLRALPKPAGVMACNDFRAVQLLDACRRARVAVPEEVAVIGVDNEPVACEIADPTLSSVVPDAVRIGYEAAATLDSLMRGRRATAAELCLPPVGVVTRRSTDIMAIIDPLVASAVEFIRRHACDGINVEDLLHRLDVSRSVLQRRFRQSLHRSIHDAIIAERLRKVKELAAETTLSLPEIAARAGFVHAEYLSTVFKERTGVTISDYRKGHATGARASRPQPRSGRDARAPE
jgi:LacI family transcriptional regulator